MYTPSYLDKRKPKKPRRHEQKEPKSNWSRRAITRLIRAKVPHVPDLPEDGIGAVCIPFGCDRKLVCPKLDWPLVNTCSIAARLRSKDVPLVAVGHSDFDYPDAPYSLYASRWPVPRPVKAFADLVASIRELDALGLEVCWVDATTMTRLFWHYALLPSLRAALDPRVARSLCIREYRQTLSGYLVLWRTAPNKTPSARPPGLSHWFRYSLYTFQILRSTAGAVPQGWYLVGPSLYIPDDMGRPMVDRVRVRASDTESVSSATRSVVARVDYEQPIRDAVYAALALDRTCHALVLTYVSIWGVDAAWFTLRDAYARPLAAALFRGIDAGAEQGIVDLVCDYAGVTPAYAKDDKDDESFPLATCS